MIHLNYDKENVPRVLPPQEKQTTKKQATFVVCLFFSDYLLSLNSIFVPSLNLISNSISL